MVRESWRWYGKPKLTCPDLKQIGTWLSYEGWTDEEKVKVKGSGERNVKIWIDFRKSPRFSLTSPLSQEREKSSRPVFTMCGEPCKQSNFRPSNTFRGSMVFNATFNNISAKSWQSVLLVEETGVPGENH